MTTAEIANETQHNIGHDFTLLDAFDSEFVDAEAVEDVDLMTKAERQALNARMAEYFA